MNITEELMRLDPSLVLHDEGEWNNTKSAYRAFNSGGIECETGEFLYGLIRLIKPKRILETGTHFGIGASYMGMALADNYRQDQNEFPLLDTIEFLPEIHKQAVTRFEKLNLNAVIRAHLMDVADFDPHYAATPNEPVNPAPYQLILLDTEPQTRFAELVKFFPYVKEGGYIFIHDLHRHMHQIENTDHGFAWPYGPIPAAMNELVTSGKLRPFHFSTPRGLTGFYKVSEQDYKWI